MHCVFIIILNKYLLDPVNMTTCSPYIFQRFMADSLDLFSLQCLKYLGMFTTKTDMFDGLVCLSVLQRLTL